MSNPFAGMREGVSQSVKMPAAAVLRGRAIKQQRVRRASTAGVIATLVIGVTFGASQLTGGQAAPFEPLAPSPSSSAPLDPNDPMRKVVFNNAELIVNQTWHECPNVTGTMTLTDTPLSGRHLLIRGPIEIGDLSGDGRAEAALTVECVKNGPPQLLVASLDGAGKLKLFNWVGAGYIAHEIRDGVLYAVKINGEVGKATAFEWDQRITGNEVVYVERKSEVSLGYPSRLPSSPGAIFDVSLVAAKMGCRAPQGSLEFDKFGVAVDGEQTWRLDDPTGRGRQVPTVTYAQIPPDTEYRLITALRCTEPGKPGRYSMVLLNTFKSGWQAIGAAVPVDQMHYVSDWKPDGDAWLVTFTKINSNPTESVTTRFTWDGKDLVAN